jgi:protein-S-isoprenylcysteine O-methyltransferase Ste14
MIGGAVTGFAGAWAGTTSAGRRGRRAGLAGMTLALVATLRAQLDMGRSWRIGVDAAERTELVTKGTFSRSRNPIFTCMGGFAVATALAVPSAATLAGATLVITGVQMQVRLVEEPYLEATHGDAYRRYAAAVGRFVPGIGRLDRR